MQFHEKIFCIYLISRVVFFLPGICFNFLAHCGLVTQKHEFIMDGNYSYFSFSRKNTYKNSLNSLFGCGISLNFLKQKQEEVQFQL